MDKQTKYAKSQELKSQIEDVPALVLVEFERLTVAAADDLRSKFRDAGCTYRVFKNSTIRWAVEGTSHEPIQPHLKGVTGLAYNADDPGAPARVARDFAKDNEALKVKAAVIQGDVLDAAGVSRLADMPGPRELKAKLLALFNTPATNMVKVLQAPLRDFLNVLNAKKDKDAA
jgi:large subunit ribosomal protein L10